MEIEKIKKLEVLNTEMCEALRISHLAVTAIDIKLRVGRPCVVTITHFLDDDQMAALKTVLERYELIPETEKDQWSDADRNDPVDVSED